jgi:hypothetical protein
MHPMMSAKTLAAIFLSCAASWGVDPTCAVSRPCRDLIKTLRVDNPNLALNQFEAGMEDAGLEHGPDFGEEIDFDGDSVPEQSILAWESFSKEAIFCRRDFLYIVQVGKDRSMVRHKIQLQENCYANKESLDFQRYGLHPRKRGVIEVYKEGKDENALLDYRFRMRHDGVELTDRNSLETWLVFLKNGGFKRIRIRPGSC